MNQKQFDKYLGNLIYQARVSDRKSQAWLAKKFGMSQPFVSKMERGEASLSAWQLSRLIKNKELIALSLKGL